MQKSIFLNIDKKLFILIILFSFTVFFFTSDGHRFTFDEDVAHKQVLKIVNGEPESHFVQGESRKFYEYPELFPPKKNHRPICENYVVCSYGLIGHTLTQIPFVIVNHHFHILDNQVNWTLSDFNDAHYIFWRNSADNDITFLELTYGGFFSSLSVGIFFLLCRTFNFSKPISVTLAFLLAFSTSIWAYSQTSLNLIPLTFFALLGYYFYRRFQLFDSKKSLLACSAIFGFAYFVRLDIVLFVIPIFFLTVYEIILRNKKLYNIFMLSVFPVFSYLATRYILGPLRFADYTPAPVGIPGQHPTPIHDGFLGLFFSPGVGLLIFSPILFTVFFSFVDFFKAHKKECILFLSFIVMFIIFYSTFRDWHGLNGWSARYMLPIIPFMLIPLGYSLETRKNKILKILLSIPAAFGIFSNIVYVIQDVSWFIWGVFGGNTGLYGIGKLTRSPNHIGPSVIWSFENSQLTHSIDSAFSNLQPDLYLLKMLGIELYLGSLLIMLSIIGFLLFKLLRNSSSNLYSLKPS